MPQFETTYWVSQIFWLLMSFGVLYLGVRLIVFPLFDSIFKARQEKVDALLNQAEVLTKKAESLEEKKQGEQQRQEQRIQQRLNEAHEKGQEDFQKVLAQNEKHLMKLFQNHIQKMERQETDVLKGADTFVAKAQKGSL